MSARVFRSGRNLANRGCVAQNASSAQPLFPHGHLLLEHTTNFLSMLDMRAFLSLYVYPDAPNQRLAFDLQEAGKFSFLWSVQVEISNLMTSAEGNSARNPPLKLQDHPVIAPTHKMGLFKVKCNHI